MWKNGNRQGNPNKDKDIWFVEKTAGGWGKPKNIGPPINTGKMDCYASVTRTGTLYLHGFDYDGGKGRADIYRSRFIDGRYTKPENLGDAINSTYNDWDAFIAPDESYLIFASEGRPDDLGGGDLYISFHKTDGLWTKAKNMGNIINSSAMEICPVVSCDGKYLFFTSSRKVPGADINAPCNQQGNVYWVNAKIIQQLKSEEP